TEARAVAGWCWWSAPRQRRLLRRDHDHRSRLLGSRSRWCAGPEFGRRSRPRRASRNRRGCARTLGAATPKPGVAVRVGQSGGDSGSRQQWMATRANAAYCGKDEARARMKSRLRRRAIVLYVSSVLIALATSCGSSLPSGAARTPAAQPGARGVASDSMVSADLGALSPALPTEFTFR